MDIQTINLDSLDDGPSLKLNTSKSESSNLLGVEMLMNEKRNLLTRLVYLLQKVILI